jgi:SAM-dependent methyltransferase
MTATYRKEFAEPAKADEYERSMLKSRSYAQVLWQVEQAQLASIVAELRTTHPRIESLDFAAGTGRVTAFVEPLVDASTAIEISPAMAEVARAKLTRTRILCTDVTAPNAEIEGKYDLITAFRFILNAEPSLRLAGLRALAARLRDRTSILVFNNHGHLPSHKLLMWPVHRLKRIGRGYTPDGNYMTDSQVRKVALQAGLRIERVMGCGLLSARGAAICGFDRSVRWEGGLAATWLHRFGGNQMYIARLDQ